MTLTILLSLAFGQCGHVQAVVAQPVVTTYQTQAVLAAPYVAYPYWAVGDGERLKKLEELNEKLVTLQEQNQIVIQSLRANSTEQPGGVSEATKAARAILDNRCVKCHQGDSPKGGIDLSKKLSTAEKLLVEDEVMSGRMPPKPANPLSDEDFVTIRTWAHEDKQGVKAFLKQQAKTEANK